MEAKTAPRWLSRQAKVYWNDFAPQVASWTPQVKQHLALLCDWFAIYRNAKDDVATKYKATCQIQRLSKLVGLSDSKPQKAEEGDELENFFDDTE